MDGEPMDGEPMDGEPMDGESAEVSKTLEQSDEWMQKYNDDNNEKSDLYNIPSYKEVKKRIISWKKIISSRKVQNPDYVKISPSIKKVRKRIDRQVNRMFMDFMSKKTANQNIRTKISKTGEIDCNRLIDYKFSNDIFLRMEETPNDKNHGLIIFVDYSGSMSSIMPDVLFQLVVLVKLCSKLSIPFDVYGFTTGVFSVNEERVIRELNNIHFLHLFSSKMKNNELNDAIKTLEPILITRYYHSASAYERLNTTPLDTTRTSSFALVEQFQKENKTEKPAVVFLTDGSSSERFYDKNKFLFKNRIFEFPKRNKWDNNPFPNHYLKMFKSVYPHIPVINFYLLEYATMYMFKDKQQETYKKNGVITLTPKNSETTKELKYIIEGFDYTHVIKISRERIDVSFSNEVDSLDDMLKSVIKTSLSAKQVNTISREFMSVFA
jgi:hypothetical protein